MARPCVRRSTGIESALYVSTVVNSAIWNRLCDEQPQIWPPHIGGARARITPMFTARDQDHRATMGQSRTVEKGPHRQATVAPAA
jgi:hypothetical protein